MPSAAPSEPAAPAPGPTYPSTPVAPPTPASPLSPVRTLASKILVPVLAVGMLSPWASSGMALLSGIVLALTIGNPWPERTRGLAHKLLTWSVVGLGAGMNLSVVARVGIHGFGYTAVGIATAFVLGTFLGKRLRIAKDTSLLVTVGTAICGGSAIAAVAPAIRAKPEEVTMSLVTVFLLNAVGLFVFPTIGHHFHLEESSFGLWCALAIHDTSSVVGAAAQYGKHALEVATAAKLARALWIVPITFALAMYRARTAGANEAGAPKPKRPWFIAGFLGVAAIVTYVPAARSVGHFVSEGAHRVLAVTLFLMGLGLSREALKALGFRPLIQAITLWFVLASATLFAIVRGWIV